MAKIIHKTDKEVWVFSSRQMGGIKALVNMLKDDNNPLEEVAKQVVKEALEILPEGAKVEDIKVETSNVNGPIVNAIVKASISQ